MIVEAGADIASVQADIQDAVGSGVEVITSEVLEEENAEGFDEVISIFNNILLAFAFIIVFVATFIINNTFQIVVAQRIRELGLLRAIGATGQQVSRSVYLEALLVGIFSTVSGILLGLLLGTGLRGLLNTVGFSLPAGPLVLAPRTVVWAIAVGIGVTMLSAIVPARRACTISRSQPSNPISVWPGESDPAPVRRWCHDDDRCDRAGHGAVRGVVHGQRAHLRCDRCRAGVRRCQHVESVVRPAGRHRARAPLPGSSVSGQIAQGNAARSPRRTASTAGALMIGLALVGMAGVVGSSLTKTFLDTRQFRRGRLLHPVDLWRVRSVGHLLRGGRRRDRGAAGVRLGRALPLRPGLIQINGENKDVFAADINDVERHLDADIVSGGLTDADAATSIAIHEDPATDLGLSVGDTVDVTFPDFETDTLTIVAIYTDSSIFGNYLIDNVVWEDHFNRSGLGFASATVTSFDDDLPQAEQDRLLEEAAAAIQRSPTGSRRLWPKTGLSSARASRISSIRSWR